MKKTPRGFVIYGEFKDSYKSTIRVQESSSAIRHCCWIYCDNAPEVFERPTPHLTKAQAKKLIKALERFIAHDQ